MRNKTEKPMFETPQEALEYHVTGAIERGEKQAIEAVVAPKHTPGPWSARYGKRADGFDFACIIEHSTNKVIIDDVTSGDRDAALIAAAPEMLEALEFFVSEAEARDPLDRTAIMARRVINEAKGGV